MVLPKRTGLGLRGSIPHRQLVRVRVGGGISEWDVVHWEHLVLLRVVTSNAREYGIAHLLLQSKEYLLISNLNFMSLR